MKKYSVNVKGVLANAVLVAVSVVVTLLLMEGFIALFNPQKVLLTSAPDIFFERYDPELGWINKEGAEGIYRPDPNIPAVSVRINQLGFRGKPLSLDKGPGVKRVLFLGDSNTFGYGVEEGERFTDLFEKMSPAGVEVVNLGVYAYGTDQEAILFEREGLKYRPDIVVLGFTAGDLSDNMSSVNGGVAKPFCRFEGDRLTLNNVPVPLSSPLMKSRSREWRFKDFLYRHSHLYRLILGRLIASNIYMPDTVMEMDEEEGMKTTLGIIKGVDALCKESGCRLVVLLISHGVWIDALRKDPNATVGYYPHLKTALERMEVPVIDTTERFLKRPDDGGTLFFGKDPVHLTPKGHLRVAEAVHEGLASFDRSQPKNTAR